VPGDPRPERPGREEWWGRLGISGEEDERAETQVGFRRGLRGGKLISWESGEERKTRRPRPQGPGTRVAWWGATTWDGELTRCFSRADGDRMFLQR
jgi:hypothetical protein